MVEIEEKQQTEPINYDKLIEDFFRTTEYEQKYIKTMTSRILSGDSTNFTPELKVDLLDLDENLLRLFRENAKTFFEIFQTGLYKRLLFDPDVKDLFGLLGINNEDMHIIPIAEGLGNIIPEISNFSLDLRDYRSKVCNFIGRFMNIGLERSIEFKSLAFECLLCGSEFTIPAIGRKTREKYFTPKFCIKRNCKAKSKTDFHLIEEKCENFEIRKFSIGDIDINKEIEEKRCIIRKNIPYFIEKVRGINLNEEVEVLGTLHIDMADLYSRKDEQEFLYYIEVLDVKPRESKIIDENIVKELYKQLEKDPLYCNEIIDSIHPYSKGIYDYFIAKLVITLSHITCDSWDETENKRNSLNSIVGGHKGSLKTRICRAFQKILGQNMFGIINGGKTTAIGLIPTAQRNNKEKNLVKRYGALAYYNRKTLVIDESQYLKEDALECLKYLDDGKIERAMDGLIINAPAKESLILSLNYKSENEAYDYTKPLIENLGFPEDQQSILDRFDLHYIIPRLKKRNNQILFRRNFKEITNIETKERIYNYLLEAKRIYTEGISIPQDLIDVIEKLNNFFFQEKSNKVILTPREPVIITKLVKGISALKFKKTVDDSDIEYLKKHLIHTIIPFQEENLLAKIRLIDMKEIFQKTFILLTELEEEISISEHIEFIRDFLESHYFQYKDPQIKDPAITRKIDEYMPDKTGLGDNWKYRALVEDPEIKKLTTNQGFIMGLIDNKTHFIKKRKGKITSINKLTSLPKIPEPERRITNEKIELSKNEQIENENYIIKRIEEIFEDNNFKPLDENSLKQRLGVEFEKELINRAFDFCRDNEILISDENNDDLIYFKKENLLNVRKDGAEGGRGKGDK